MFHYAPVKQLAFIERNGKILLQIREQRFSNHSYSDYCVYFKDVEERIIKGKTTCKLGGAKSFGSATLKYKKNMKIIV